MIFETLAHMADREDDGEDNYSSTEQQTKAMLEALAAGGNLTLANEVVTVAGTRQILNNKPNEFKHVIVGMQKKHSLGIVQGRQLSSSSSSSSSSYGGFTPSLSCPGGNPSLVLTVTGASGTVNWCGETWVLPEESGTGKEICPTHYSTWTNNANPSVSLAVGEEWAFIAGPGDKIGIKHRAYDYPTWYSNYNEIVLKNSLLTGNNHADRRWKFKTTGGFSSATNIANIGALSTGTSNYATANNYRIPDSYFTSYTSGGITFAWERGTNW